MKNNTSIKKNRITKGLAAFGMTVVLAMAAASVHVIAGEISIDDTGSVVSEKAACNNGTSQQSRADCLLEAKNANADKKAGLLEKDNQGYKANALIRCERLIGDDRKDCRARVMGEGKSTGSVAGGGVITEVETVVPPKPKGEVRLPK